MPVALEYLRLAGMTPGGRNEMSERLPVEQCLALVARRKHRKPMRLDRGCPRKLAFHVVCRQTSPSQGEVFALSLVRDFLGPLKVAGAECREAAAKVHDRGQARQLDLLVVEKQVRIDALKEQATWRYRVLWNQGTLGAKIAEPGAFRLLDDELGAARVALDGLGQVRQAQALVFRHPASLTFLVEAHEFIH